MTTTYPDNYFDRTDESKEYEQHLFIAGRGLQSAELNEIQRAAAIRTKGIADALFKDGDIIRDAQITVDSSTGATICGSGAVYLRGAVRGVAPANLTIPVTGTVSVGIRLIETIVTAAQDPTLRDPASGTRNYDEPGAERLKVHAQWGWSGDNGAGDFFPVYSVTDGIVGSKEAPPNLDSVTQALARYDRDSAGGSYVVSGLALTKLDDVGGNQVYSLAEGRARVFGYAVEIAAARRLVYGAVPDLKFISNEPHLSSTAGSQRVNFDRSPATGVSNVSITKETTATLTHGTFTGAQDPLPDTSVLQIVEVKQGATTYTQGVDYQLTAGKVDWSLGGAEPAPGSTYTCKYQHLTPVTPTELDLTGFTVTGAVAGTLILVTYNQMLPRIDRLCLDQEGTPVWVKGVSADFYPQIPPVPDYFLPLASVRQTWDASRTVSNDGVRVVPMPELATINARFDLLTQLVAQQRLESDIHTRESGTKLGLFTDPFLDDSQRDAGTAQTAAIVNGELLLPITATITNVDADVGVPTTCAYSTKVILSQTRRTGQMKINPYMAFAPLPARLSLTPSVDRWTESETVWASQQTSRFVVGAGDQSSTTVSTRNVLLSRTTIPIERLRQIQVSFEASGFGPGENLSQVTFDGLTVTATAP